MATVEQLEREIKQLRDEIVSGRLFVKHAEQHRRGGGDPHGIIVEETDGSPSAKRVTKIVVTADTLTDNADGSVNLAIGAGSGVTDHASLTGVTASQHHAQAHTLSGSDHTGTLALSQHGPQNPNVVLAGPASGGAANPSFRDLVTADLPDGAVLVGDVIAGVGIAVTAGASTVTIAQSARMKAGYFSFGWAPNGISK